MKTKDENQIPKIAHLSNSWIAEQKVRCGKPNCRCARGTLHPAHYLFTRTDGKLLKRYIQKDDVARVREEVKLARAHRKARRERIQFANREFRRLKAQLEMIDAEKRELDRILNGYD